MKSAFTTRALPARVKALSAAIHGVVLLGSTLVVAAPALAQTDTDAQQNASIEEIEVTGYRKALLNSIDSKRDSVGFSDEIFSDDIGKLPSNNLAESLSRIPGVNINREVTGEGQQIAVRGLGPSFTKVVMNGNSISVASDGSLGSGQRGRQVDLDMFPSELFKSLSVSKTATASQTEGGVSGYVNMRTIRASDRDEGFQANFGAEASYNEMSGDISPKYSFTASYSGEKFGVLVGLVDRGHKSRVDGFETIGNFQSGCVAEWVDADNRGCVAGSSGWNVFHYSNVANADYAAANPGVNVGDPIDINAVSGLTDEQLDNFGMPYIARSMTTTGNRDSLSGLVSFEYLPNEDLEITLDILNGKAERNFVREELMGIYRRNYIQYGLEVIPENIQLGDDGHLVSGTFYGARPWVGSRDYEEELTFTSVMPALSWQINDSFKVDLSASMTESEFDRDEPYLLYYGPAGTMYFAYDGEFPTIQYDYDTGVANDGWTLQAGPGLLGDEIQPVSFRFQRNARDTETKAFHADFAFGEDPDRNGIKFGVAWDEVDADMQGFSGEGFLENYVEGSDLVANFQNYLINANVSDLGNSISGYNGISGIASVDWDAVKEAVSYGAFQPATAGGGDQFGKVVGDISEEILAFYAEINTETEIAGRTLRTNAGLRWVDTEQTVSTIDAETNQDYRRLLPSLSAVYDLTDEVKLRFSTSRSLTRANPSDMFPNTSWGSSGIDTASAGNPNLDPFEATNFDFGGEWYFNDMGYVGLNYYTKDITGFTRSTSIPVQFADLGDWGIDINDLSSTQQDALEECGGVTSADCVTSVNTKENIKGTVKLTGFEAIWVMPLDFLTPGLGFNVSANNIRQDADDPDAEITGIADSLNFTGYYEKGDFQSRITYYFTDKATAGESWGSPLWVRERAQVDLSASYKLPIMVEHDLTVSFDAYNLTNEPISTYMEHSGQTFSVYYPGASFAIGIRGSL